MKRPNILYVNSHDTGRSIQPYGHAVATPHLQRLAEEGILFRQAFCAAPTCSPSRAALLTGQWPHNSGMLGLSHRGFSLSDYSQHIIHTLRRHGYYCALSGVQHVDGPGRGTASYASRIGYDVILDRKDMPSQWGHPMAEQCAAEFLSGQPPQPFFLEVGFGQTHRPFPNPAPEDDPRYTLVPASMPDTPQTRLDMAGFKTSVRTLDCKIGVVLDALRASGLLDNTLVIYTTDHGMAFPGMKCNLTDQGIGVAQIMRGPGGFSGGQVCDALVSHIDLFPTICDLLEVPPPPWLAGCSMMPLVREEAQHIREEVFAEVTYQASYEPQRCVRTRRWNYIRRFDHRQRVVLPNCDDGPSKTVWLEEGWRDQPRAQEMLFDLAFDPNETNNLAGQPQCAPVLAPMRARLDRWMRETEDPLLKGPVPLPPGGVVNDPDQLSPRDPLSGTGSETPMPGR